MKGRSAYGGSHRPTPAPVRPPVRRGRLRHPASGPPATRQQRPRVDQAPQPHADGQCLHQLTPDPARQVPGPLRTGFVRFVEGEDCARHQRRELSHVPGHRGRGTTPEIARDLLPGARQRDADAGLDQAVDHVAPGSDDPLRRAGHDARVADGGAI